MTRALYPGSFDPVTYGHLDVIRRAVRVFGELIVGVGDNPEKAPWFSAEERIELIGELVREMDNVKVEAYDGLTFEFAVAKGARVIIRGIRDSVDLRAELQAANTNLIVGEIETVFLMASDRHQFIASRFVKEIGRLDGDISQFVSPRIAKLLIAKKPK